MSSMLAAPVPELPGAFWAVVPIEARPDPGFLTPSERALFEQLGGERRQREWLAGRRAARAALRAVGAGACSVLRDDRGAPRLEGPNAERVEIALTHGRDHAAAVASRWDGPWPCVGIDWVDAADAPRIRRVASRVLGEAERVLVGDADLPLQLAWGAREALAKATRTGMFAYALTGVHLVAYDAATGVAEVDVEEARVRFRQGPEDALIVVAGLTLRARARARRTDRGRATLEPAAASPHNPVDATQA